MKPLKKMRLDRGYTLQYVADKIGTTTSQLSYYENGKREPRDKEIWNKLAKVYNVSLANVMGFDRLPTDVEVKQIHSGLAEITLDAQYKSLIDSYNANNEKYLQSVITVDYTLATINEFIKRGELEKIDQLLTILNTIVEPLNGICSPNYLKVEEPKPHKYTKKQGFEDATEYSEKFLTDKNKLNNLLNNYFIDAMKSSQPKK